MPKPITLTERVDRDALRHIIEHPDEYDLGRCWVEGEPVVDRDSVLTLLKDYYNDLDSNGFVVREYQRKEYKGFEYGRFCISNCMNNFGLASMYRPIRHTISRDTAIDIDIKNCHNVILEWYCDVNKIECPQLKHFNRNRDEVASKYSNGDKDEFKRMMLKMVNGGGANDPVIHNNTYLKTFYEEQQHILDVVSQLESETFKRFDGMWNDRGKLMSNMLQSYEVECLMAMYKALRDENIRVYNLIHDGLMIEKNNNNIKGLPELLSKCESQILSDVGLNVVVVEKQMDEGFDISMNIKKAKKDKSKRCECSVNHSDLRKIIKFFQKIELLTDSYDDFFTEFSTFLLSTTNDICGSEFIHDIAKNNPDYDEEEVNEIIEDLEPDNVYSWQWLCDCIPKRKQKDADKTRALIKKYIQPNQVKFIPEVSVDIVRDDYVFHTFQRNIQKIVFQSYREMLDYTLEYLPKVVFPITHPPLFLIKEDIDKVEVKNEFAIPKCYIKYLSKDKNGDVMDVNVLLKDFLISPDVWRSLNHLKNIVFEPNLAKAYPHSYNLFDGFIGDNRIYNPLTPDEEQKIQPVLNHIFECLANSNEDHYDYIVSFFANIIQSPDKKGRVALILYSSKQQCGKNFTTDFMNNYVFGRKYSCDVNSVEEVLKEKNADMVNKILITINEVSSKSSSFHSDHDKLKDAICNERMTARKLYQDPIEVNDYRNFVLTTNNLASVRIEASGDARFCAFDVSDKFRMNFDYFKLIREQCFNNECGNLVYRYLYNYNITRDIRKIPNTQLRNTMIEMSASPVYRFIQDVKAYIETEKFKEQGGAYVERWDYHIRNHLASIERTIGARELYKAYTMWCNECGEKKTTETKFGAVVKETIEFKRDVCGIKYIFK